MYVSKICSAKSTTNTSIINSIEYHNNIKSIHIFKTFVFTITTKDYEKNKIGYYSSITEVKYADGWVFNIAKSSFVFIDVSNKLWKLWKSLDWNDEHHKA